MNSFTDSRLRQPAACAVACLLLSLAAAADEEPLDHDALEASGARIGRIELEKHNVFDLDDPRENNWLFRLANRLHVVTRDNTIRKQLLLREGEPFSARLLAESERILRDKRYFYDASILPYEVEDGRVHLRVVTRDVWTLTPDLSLSRSGGENRTKFGIEELNLLGNGQILRLNHVDDVERESNSFEFADPHVAHSWVRFGVRLDDNSDGHSRSMSAIRPFYALDVRWSAGGSLLDDDRESSLYRLGEEAAEFRRRRDYLTAFLGWSPGLSEGWVWRYRAGFVYDDNRFSEVPDATLPPAVPEDRRLVYPFVGVELLEDRFQTSKNHDQIDRTEDFFMGTRFTAQVGYASGSTGANRTAYPYAASLSRGLGSLEDEALLLGATVNGRLESGRAVNSVLAIDARYYHRQSRRRLFFATISAQAGNDLDIDNPVEIGGDSGLRGYPLRYQGGDSRMLLTLEQRYFTDWYPFRLLRVGGAIFFDVGRVWGDDPVNDSSQGWLRDAGFGLRFAPTRNSSNRMIHLDIAFPLDGDESIDGVQVLLESKQSF